MNDLPPTDDQDRSPIDHQSEFRAKRHGGSHQTHATGTNKVDFQTALDRRIAYAGHIQSIMEQLIAQAIRRGFKVYGFEERSVVGSKNAKPVPLLIASVEVIAPELEHN